MKEKKSDLTIDKDFFGEKTTFEKFEEKVKISIFGVLFVLLKNGENNFWIEMVSLLSELFQFMYYPFSESVIIILL